MKVWIALVCLLATFSFACAQSRYADLDILDDYLVVTEPLLITIPQNPVFPIIQRGYAYSSEIFGGERDLELTVTFGDPLAVVSASIESGDFSCSTPQEATGLAVLQYDGQDGTATLNPSGLYNEPGALTDLTRGDAFAFHLDIESDLNTIIILRVYSGSLSDYCQFDIPVPGDDTLHPYYLAYEESQTIGSGCDFSSVGAIEIRVSMFENVDVLIDLFATYGPVPATPTPSRTRTRSPSPIPTPTSTPSVTPTRTPISASPSASPSERCLCRCPVFTCHVIRLGDGDEHFTIPGYDPRAAFNVANSFLQLIGLGQE